MRKIERLQEQDTMMSSLTGLMILSVCHKTNQPVIESYFFR